MTGIINAFPLFPQHSPQSFTGIPLLAYSNIAGNLQTTEHLEYNGGIPMIDHTQIQYFLGANTPQGFYSLYGKLLPNETAKGIYILKGGAGCGKSTLMRQIDNEAQARGYKTEQILCSGDPDSLDGLIIPQLNIALADGTAPHIIEPNFAGVVEQYINVGDCYDSTALQNQRESIIQCSKVYKEATTRITPCLSAAGELAETISALLHTEKLAQRLTKRANGIINREIKSKFPKSPQDLGTITQRFLSANTSQGRIALHHSITLQCDKIFQLWDSYSIAHGLLLPLMTAAVQRGYDVVACLNPMNPKHLEHLIIPELSLAFLTSSPALPFDQDCDRKIRLETMLDSGLLKQNRTRLRTYRKMYHTLLDETLLILEDNKKIHDQLEALYHPYVDFTKLSQLTANLGKEIFQD